jgi:Domain of unknown function (DUF4160)
VPRVSFFYGIVITMYFWDHQPPHFHACYAEHQAAIAIGDGTVLVGELPLAPASWWLSGASCTVRSLKRTGAWLRTA